METRKDVKLSPLPIAWRIAQELIHHGYSAYIVGGWIRDSLLGKQPYDCDLAVSALPHEILSCLTHWKTFETGRRHGTITVLADGHPVEVTTFRRDGEYTDVRHPDRVYFTDSVWEDLQRRDFTMNAMAYHPQQGLLDPVGGFLDVQSGILRAVGNPRQRFTQDALRILRAVRFCAVLGFSIEDETRYAMFDAMDGLRFLSRERIQKELFFTFHGSYIVQALERCKPVWQTLFPFYKEESFFATLLDRLERTPPDFLARLCLFLWPLSSPERMNLLHSLRFDSKTIADVTLLLENLSTPGFDKVSFCKLYGSLGEKSMQSFLAVGEAVGILDVKMRADCLKWMEQVTQHHLCCSRKELAVNGEDLLLLGVPSGRKMGAVLEELLHQVIKGKIPNERNALLSFAKELVQ